MQRRTGTWGTHCEAQRLTSNVVLKQNKHLAVPKSKSKNTIAQLVDIYFLGLSNNIRLFPASFKKKKNANSKKSAEYSKRKQ